VRTIRCNTRQPNGSYDAQGTPAKRKAAFALPVYVGANQVNTNRAITRKNAC